MEQPKDELRIGKRIFSSRLFIGTGKFPSAEIMAEAVRSSETELVTVALRRLDLDDPNDEFITHLDPEKVLLVPNTSGARDAEEALRLARLGRAGCGNDWVKLELTPEPRYLLPDPIETLKAAELLVKDGFNVLPYMGADPVLAKRLEETGCPAVMPLGSPIGSNQGIRTKEMIAIIIEQSNVPVIVDAGIGLPSHAAEAMEMGASAVLVNTAVATAQDPVSIAYAFKLAVEAGRIASMNSRVVTRTTASASSPTTGFVRSLRG